MPGEPARADAGEAGALRDCDGLVVGLYRHLWLKNAQGRTCSVNIPQTVIFQDSAPVAWYFTSLKENRILRKRSPAMGPAMSEAFMAGRSEQPEVCGWFSGNVTTTQGNVRKSQQARPTISLRDDEDELVVHAKPMEHLTYDRVQQMLDPGPYRLITEEHIYDGVVQKFLEPRNPNDFIIRAIWTPQAVIFEKRMNKNNLIPRPDQGPYQQVPPLVDRIASFSGNFWLHDHKHVPAGTLRNRLTQQCEAIATHLREVTEGQTKVTQMHLFFKIDPQHRIWLLFCTNMKVFKAPPNYAAMFNNLMSSQALQGAAAPLLLKAEAAELRAKAQQAKEEEEASGTAMCVVTGKVYPKSQIICVPYKLLMQHWFSKCAELASESDRVAALDSIPPAIRRANPNLTREFYLRSRSQPFFLLNLAKVGPEANEELLQAAYTDLNLSYHQSRRVSGAGARRSSQNGTVGGAGGRPTSRESALPAVDRDPPSPWKRQIHDSSAPPQRFLPPALVPKGRMQRPPWQGTRASSPGQGRRHGTPLATGSNEAPRPSTAPTGSMGGMYSPLPQGAVQGAQGGQGGNHLHLQLQQQQQQQQHPGGPLSPSARPATALGTIAEEAGGVRGSTGSAAGSRPVATTAGVKGGASVSSSMGDLPVPAAWGTDSGVSGGGSAVALWSLKSGAPAKRLEYASHYSSLDSHPTAAGPAGALHGTGTYAYSEADSASLGAGMGPSGGGGLGDSWQSSGSRGGGFGGVGSGAAAVGPGPRVSSGRSSASVASSFLNSSEVRRLREMSDTYAQAEAVTQQLLDQAHQLLQSPSGSFSGHQGAAGAAAQVAGAGPGVGAGAQGQEEGRTPAMGRVGALRGAAVAGLDASPAKCSEVPTEAEIQSLPSTGSPHHSSLSLSTSTATTRQSSFDRGAAHGPGDEAEAGSVAATEVATEVATAPPSAMPTPAKARPGAGEAEAELGDEAEEETHGKPGAETLEGGPSASTSRTPSMTSNATSFASRATSVRVAASPKPSSGQVPRPPSAKSLASSVATSRQTSYTTPAAANQ